ncbi:MAG: RnfABCDGE type electron transport complex subunit D [Wenzhouxiangella sp.]
MQFPTAGAPHLPPQRRVDRIMRQVLYALLPGILAHWLIFGWGIFFQIALAVGFALLFEWLMLRARGRPVRIFLSDYSVVVTAVLFALCVPPLAPWWIAAVGMLFAVVIAKHLYGGLGYNLFNPTMVGLAAVIIAFPLDLSLWLAPRSLSPGLPSVLDTARAILTGQTPHLDFDAITRATPLDLLRSGAMDQLRIPEIQQDDVFGRFGAVGWNWIVLAYLAGGVYLLGRGLIRWQAPVGVLAAALLISSLLWLSGTDVHPSPGLQLFAGSLVLAAFFIVTDPVSGSATPRGRLLFGIGVAVITLAIRQWGGFPDGVAFAVLLMNMFVPLIDRYTQPRVYGLPR